MVTGGGGNVYLSRKTPEVLSGEPCSGTIECALMGVADHLLILLWLVLLLLTAVATLAFLPRARELCDRERRRTRAEYNAFDQFIDRIRALSPASTTSVAEPAGAVPLVQRQFKPHGSDVAEVRAAYEETVMAVPHFEEDYDETLDEHMGAEFSEEIAEATIAGSEFGKPMKRSLLDAASDARDSRAQFLDLLNEEATSLNRHEKRLDEIQRLVDEATAPLCADQSFEELRGQLDSLAECETALEKTVDRRQSDRTERQSAVLRVPNELDLQEYLYQSMDVTYPVLAEATRLLSRIEVATRRVEDELIYRA